MAAIHAFDTEQDNHATPLKSSGNRLWVTLSGSGTPRNREQNAVAGTRQSVTWVSPGVTEVTVNVMSETAGTAQLPGTLAVCFDAPNDAVADAWLTAADSATADSQRYLVTVGSSGARTFTFASPITRLDMVRAVGGEAFTVVVEAM